MSNISLAPCLKRIHTDTQIMSMNNHDYIDPSYTWNSNKTTIIFNNKNHNDINNSSNDLIGMAMEEEEHTPLYHSHPTINPFTTSSWPSSSSFLPTHPRETRTLLSSPAMATNLFSNQPNNLVHYHHLGGDNQEDQDHADDDQEPEDELGPMKEMMYKIAAMQPVDIDPASVRKPKRRNVRISDDPQSVAARHRRERISEKIRILQRLVPGGTKMDTASMLDEAIRYVKFLKRQIRQLQSGHPPPLQLPIAAETWAPPSNSYKNPTNDDAASHQLASSTPPSGFDGSGSGGDLL